MNVVLHGTVHGRTVELDRDPGIGENRVVEVILRTKQLPGDQETTATTLEAYLRKMPDVGTDADFSRIEGSLRDIDLAE